MSDRNARWATAKPRIANQAIATALSPHWLGEHQAWGVMSIASASTKLVGLKMCLPRVRTRNLEAIAAKAATTAIQGRSVLSKSESPSELMIAERYPTGRTLNSRVIPHWVAQAVAKISGGCQSGRAECSTVGPAVRQEAKNAICGGGGC